MFDFLEGSRAFSIVYGLVTGSACLAVAIPILWWYLPNHRRSFFPRAIDQKYRLQLWYGIFAMAMAFTDIGCRTIPHDRLALVHPTFFLMTLVLVGTLGPRVIAMAREASRTSLRTDPR
jgi:hypothetical protein